MSSATVHTDARTALRTHLQALSGVPELAPEGFGYTPKARVPFIEDRVVPLLSEARSLGAIEHEISYTLTLKYPPNEGTADIEEMAGQLLDHFKVGTKLTHGTTTWLSYGAARRGGIIQETDWQVLTVAVRLQTFSRE